MFPASVSHMETFSILVGGGCWSDTERLFIWTSCTSAQQRQYKNPSDQSNQFPWNLYQTLHFVPWPNHAVRVSRRKTRGSSYWFARHRYPFLQEASRSHTLASGLSLPVLSFQTKTFLSSPKEYTARVLCLRGLNFYSYLHKVWISLHWAP